MPTKDSTMVRLKRPLVERLREVARRIDRARVAGHPGLQAADGELALPAVIERLLNHWERHAERRKRSAQTCSGRAKKGEAKEEVTDG